MEFLLNNNEILSYILILVINIIPDDFDFLLTSDVKRLPSINNNNNNSKNHVHKSLQLIVTGL